MGIQPRSSQTFPRPGFLLTLDMFRHLFEPQDWSTGRDIHQNEKVTLSHSNPKGCAATVQHQLQTFEVLLSLNGFDLQGTCTCDARTWSCRHKAAAFHLWFPRVMEHLHSAQQGMGPADEQHLQKIIEAFLQHGALHEAHQLKLQLLLGRSPQRVSELLEKHGCQVLLSPKQVPVLPPRPRLSSPAPTASIPVVRPAPVAAPVPVATPKRQLIFFLDVANFKTRTPTVYLRAHWATLKEGGVVESIPYAQGTQQPEGMDQVLMKSRFSPQGFCKPTFRHQKTIEYLLEKGRIYLRERPDQPLKAAPPRRGEAVWRMDEVGTQHAVFEVEPRAKALVIGDVWYVDPLTLQLGRVDTGVSGDRLGPFLQLPPVRPHQVEQMQMRLQALLSFAFPLPQTVELQEELGTPEPCLNLLKVTTPTGERVPQVELTFTYRGRCMTHGMLLPNGSPITSRLYFQGGEPGEVTVVHRNEVEEEKCIQLLQQLGFFITSKTRRGRTELQYGPKGQPPTHEDWLSLKHMVLPHLKNLGWSVHLELPGRYRTHKSTPGLKVRSVEGCLEMELGVEVEGRQVSLLPLLRGWMSIHDHDLSGLMDSQDSETLMFLPVGEDVQVGVEAGRLKGLLQLMLDCPTASSLSNVLRIPKVRALKVMEFAQKVGLKYQLTEQVKALVTGLQDLQHETALQLPLSLQATLRPYQEEGVKWLELLRHCQMGGILADDMGLGKTLQTLTHILIQKEKGHLQGPVLVVAPTSLMANWAAETRKFTPTLTTLLWHGSRRSELEGQLSGVDVVFTTYKTLQLDQKVLAGVHFDTVVLDEAQNIKNHQSKSHRALKALQCQHRLCLTGTPLENHLGELWSLFDFLMPGYLPTEQHFEKQYRVPVEQNGDETSRKELQGWIKPLMLRRRKDQVARDLPPKTEITVPLELQGKQRDVYEAVRVTLQGELQQDIAHLGVQPTRLWLLSGLLKLRQACCDPRLLPHASSQGVEDSVKRQWIRDTLPEMLSEGRKVLVFSQFAQMLGLLHQELTDLGIECAVLTGQTQDRAEQVRRFQGGEVKVFLISLKAGGVGLNLTAADTVIHYDPWWNPAAENQATDRAYRIGQDKPVFVYKLVTTGTIEEHVMALQAHKVQLAQGILEGTLGEGLQVTQEDLKLLLLTQLPRF